jgi:predicted TIM-barrel fold metal-dependent hydrolase
MAGPRKEWLDRTPEAPLEPALPICDPHHHFWDRPDDRYLLDDLLDDLRGGHNVVSTVFVECREMWRAAGPDALKPVGETEFVQGIAAMSASGRYGPTAIAAGIVGFADLTLGDGVAAVLEAHLAASPTRFRGIRHPCTWDASPAVKVATPGIPRWLMADPKFRTGLARLQKSGLSFEAWLYHPQLPELPALARALPELPIVLNHVGGLLGVGPYAGRRAETFEEWKRSMREVAACRNVVVKLGGLGMVRCGFGWSERPAPPTSTELAEATAPYYLFCIEQFGPDRCMFESNFPVDKLSYSYTVAWNSFKRMTQGFSAAERAALFHDTAVRVYRLGPGGQS